MRAIIIGAGRGSRLEHLTDEIPKTLVTVMGRPILDWVLDALAAGGFARKDVIFICGYGADVLRRRYPDLTYVENRDWEKNNILASLFMARDHMLGGFVCTYADIIYRGSIVSSLMDSPGAMVLGCDTDWRRRYTGRTRHPETDAEKMRAAGNRVIEISRKVRPEDAAGEFVGVAKFTPRGAAELCGAFDRARERSGGGVFREGRTFERAYLIDLLQDMIENGSTFHRADTHGGYMEIDTVQDRDLAPSWWPPA
jgi:L-glutamine-phosphate cytidylyltransferase